MSNVALWQIAMDPISVFSLTSSIAGVLTLSGAILTNGYGYVSEIAKAPKELRLLLSETVALHTLLDQLLLMVELNNGGEAAAGVFGKISPGWSA